MIPSGVNSSLKMISSGLYLSIVIYSSLQMIPRGVNSSLKMIPSGL